jgi:UDP-glucose 4-epimerase
MLKDKSIVITGGAGFIGSHLADALASGNDVAVFDNFSSGKMEYLAKQMDNPHFRVVQGDLLDMEGLMGIVEGADVVFHLAANPDVKLGAENTSVHLDQNILATHNLLEAMRIKGVKRIAFTSTSTIYGEASIVPTPENYGPLKPISLYGASKLACEALISSYCHTFDMQSWIYRFANIVGDRGTHGVLVDFIRKLQSNPKDMEILGSGKQRKSYLEVKDCVSAMIYCVENSSEQVNIFNVGSRDTIDVTEIAEIVAESMGLSGVKYRYTGGLDGRGWKGDVKTMLLSIESLEKLGWSPSFISRESIRSAVHSLLSKS